MTDQPGFLLFAHSGSHNHGCEALLRTITNQLHQKYEQSKITVCSFHPEEDKRAEVPYIDALINHNDYVKRYSPDWLFKGINRKTIQNLSLHYQLAQKHIIREAKENDVCISIGGDIYCYKKPYIFYTIDKAIKQSSKKLVLWGCSIDCEHIDDDMLKDLSRFDLIMPRESITMGTLCELLPHSNIVRINDPAFTMETEHLPLPEGWRHGNMVGLNVSPLCAAYEESKGVTLASFSKLIRHILDTTEHSIALIPHVVRDQFSDIHYLNQLFEEFKSTGRVVLLSEDYNAPQLKGFISRCNLFVGARTHATIAAYSTGVPTLVLGYSVKARGIARDLFGDESGLVLPVQQLGQSETLLQAFDHLKERQNELRAQLSKVLPDYIKQAENAVNQIEKI